MCDYPSSELEKKSLLAESLEKSGLALKEVFDRYIDLYGPTVRANGFLMKSRDVNGHAARIRAEILDEIESFK